MNPLSFRPNPPSPQGAGELLQTNITVQKSGILAESETFHSLFNYFALRYQHSPQILFHTVLDNLSVT
jgi:hypothetical protein